MSGSAVSNPVPCVQDERRSGVGRRIGCAVAVAVNAALLYVVNVAPGWESWGLLTPSAAQVVGIVNASLWVGAGVNLICLMFDTPLVKALGDTLTAGFAAAVTLKTLQVFPFDVTDGWEWVLRAAFVLALFGSAVGVLVGLARVVGALFIGGRT